MDAKKQFAGSLLFHVQSVFSVDADCQNYYRKHTSQSCTTIKQTKKPQTKYTKQLIQAYLVILWSLFTNTKENAKSTKTVLRAIGQTPDEKQKMDARPSKLVEQRHQIHLKLYTRRWYTLALYVLFMLCNSSQWLQYSIISNIVSKFYGINSWHVNLTSLVAIGCYLPLALPAAKLMDKISLRWTAILGSTITALGSWIKVFSASSDQFNLTLTGQTVVAIAQVLMLSVPQKLSSIWFGEREVSSACSIGVFGFQLGIVVGFFLPPMLVKNHDHISLIGQDLYYMFVYFAVVSTAVAVLVLFTFQAEPPLPPTLSQARIRTNQDSDPTSYSTVLKRLCSQPHLSALFITTGVNNGCFNGLSTLLNQIFLEYFPGHEEDAGRVGVTMVIFGMLASVTFGFILDRTKKFKFVLIFIYYMSAVAMATFTVLLIFTKSVLVMYLAAAFVGTFLCGFTAVSFDVATELTYPESELTVGTIMNMMSLLFTLSTTLLFGYVNESLGYFWGNVGFVLFLILGATCTLPIKFELKRTSAQRANLNAEEKVLVIENIVN